MQPDLAVAPWPLSSVPALCLCRKEETVTIYPADVVLFEGILAFYSQEVRDLFQMKLFVDTDADTRLSRRGEFCKLQMARLVAVHFGSSLILGAQERHMPSLDLK